MNEPMQNLLKLQTLEFSETQDENAAAMIAELRSKIPAQITAHYDRLRVRGKKGVAAVHHQVCSACHMKLPLAVIMTLKHGDDVQLCDSCGRYLYLAEETKTAPLSAVIAAKSAPTARRPRRAATAA
jgi:predicted  nucleic acid-binding Zn-ribbon protein